MSRIRTGIQILLAAGLLVGLTGCGASQTAAPAETKDFTPALDTQTTCGLHFVGGYENFEALEEQIDQFST